MCADSPAPRRSSCITVQKLLAGKAVTQRFRDLVAQFLLARLGRNMVLQWSTCGGDDERKQGLQESNSRTLQFKRPRLEDATTLLQLTGKTGRVSGLYVAGIGVAGGFTARVRAGCKARMVVSSFCGGAAKRSKRENIGKCWTAGQNEGQRQIKRVTGIGERARVSNGDFVLATRS